MQETFKITDSTGVLIHRGVVQGTNANECAKPGAANAGKFIGVTQEAQASQYGAVRVQTGGRSFAVAASAIAVGDYVRLADTTGKFESAQSDAVAVPGTAKVNYVVGVARTAATADGDVFELAIQPFVVKTAAS